MYTKKIYFAGGDFHELQEVFSRVSGVADVCAGYVNANQPSVTYESVLAGTTGAALGIEVKYNPKKIDLSSLMDILFSVTSPYSKNKQGSCEGEMYRSGVYYVSDEDEPIIEYYMNFIRNRKKAPAATEAALTINDTTFEKGKARICYAEAKRLQAFQIAEAEHQNYLKTHPDTKTNIDFALLQKLGVIGE